MGCSQLQGESEGQGWGAWQSQGFWTFNEPLACEAPGPDPGLP